MDLEKILERPLDCKEIQPVHPKWNQSWIVIGTLILKLKLQYFGRLMWRTDSLEKTLMLEKIEGRRRGQKRWDSWMALPTWWTWVWASSRSWWWTGNPGLLQSMGSQRVGNDWATKLNWLSTSFNTWWSEKSAVNTPPWVLSHSSQGTLTLYVASLILNISPDLEFTPVAPILFAHA